MLAVYQKPDLLELIGDLGTLEKIEAFEAVGLEMPQIEVPVVHRFCEGVYIREATLSAGMFAIGHAHTKDCINTVLSGSVSVMIDGALKRFSAGDVFIGKAGDRKAGYVHEESRWQTVHATKETDLAALEREFLVKSSAFIAHERRVEEDRLDYQLAVAELGFTHEQVVAISCNEADRVDFGADLVFIAKSARDGLGVFASLPFVTGDKIAVASIGGKRTEGGRFTNHSSTPNAAMVADENGTVYLVATKSIPAWCEVLVDYRQTKRLSVRLTEELSCQPSH